MLRRLFRLLVVLSVLTILGVTAIWIMTNTDFGRERARRYVLGILQGETHGIVKIEAMHGNLLGGARLVRVSITDSAGNPFLRADSIGLNYVIRSFFSKRLEFSDVVLYHPDLVVAKLPGKPWNYRILWPSTPRAPGDTLPGWGSWVKLTNTTVLDGNVTVKSPWSPRAGLKRHARDSVVKDVLSAGSRLNVIAVPGGYQKVLALRSLNARLPLVRWADPLYRNRLLQVAALSTDAYPFRPPAAHVVGLTGNFDFNDDSLWWKGAAVRLPQSAMRGDGTYNLDNGDMRLMLAVAPGSFADFHWLYQRLPNTGGGKTGLTVQWKGATQDYVARDADIRSGRAHVTGDIGVTVTDTVFFHNANVRFTGLTTKQIEDVNLTSKWPRQGVLAGRAKFSGTPKRMTLDADITLATRRRGTNRVIAKGIGGYTGRKPVVVNARNLRLRLAPLQIDIVKILFPTLPVAGTLTGVATLNGSGATKLVATDMDIVHRDGGNISRAVGRGSVHTIGRQSMELDVVALPLALAEVTKFAPTLPLKGRAFGPVRAHGPIDEVQVDAELTLPGRGRFALRGPVDFLSKELGYDVVVDATALDLSRVLIGGPATMLNGSGRARGRGFKPATMYSTIAVDLGPSSVDTIAVDSMSLRAVLANGLANIEHAGVRSAGMALDVTGLFGLDSNYTGALAYALSLDSLATVARYIPGASATDTTIVKPRPRRAYEARRRARAASARIARETEVARAANGLAPITIRVPTDTPTAIPRALLSGSVTAAGTVTGSLDRFSLEGTASGRRLVVEGNAARHIEARYSWIDARTTHSKLTAEVRADTVSAFGFAFDSLAGDLSYNAPNGSVFLRVRQGGQRDYSLKGDFTLDKARNELRVAEVSLKFDSITWRSTHPSAVHWGPSGVEVVNFELSSGPGRRIFANGLLPTKGAVNFDLEVTDFAVENVAELLQSDLPITGRLDLDAHVSGTAEDPRVAGKLDFVKGTYASAAVPQLHGTFSYANKELTTNASATDTSGTKLAVVKGTIPINLALSGVTGSRLPDAPINISVASDSLPLELIPHFTDAVSKVGGVAMGSFTVGGTLKKPVLHGNLALKYGHAQVTSTGTLLERLNGSAHMTGDTIFVDSIVGMAGGPVRLAGTVAVGNWREPRFNLYFTAQEGKLISNELGTVYADAELHISGPFSAVLVSGQVTVLHGVLYVPESRGKSIIGSGDPALFNVIDTAIAVNRELFPAQSPLFKNLKVDVDLTVERGSWVRSRDANVEVFTDDPLKVNLVGDALSLTGAVNADRGEYTFLSKRFQIKRGSAVFIGTPDLNPTLQITAEYLVREATAPVNIRVLIGGTLQQPRISLESDAQPPLTQSDLLSYLAFGERSSSLLQFNQTSLQSNLINVAGARLAGIALGVALDELEGSAARSLGVDVFNITPGDFPISNTQAGFDSFLKGTEIEAGRYITPQTFVSLIVTPGAFALGSCNQVNTSCALPGGSITHRTAHGYRFEASVSPRYILLPPTLSGQFYYSRSQIGAFVIREWRF